MLQRTLIFCFDSDILASLSLFSCLSVPLLTFCFFQLFIILYLSLLYLTVPLCYSLPVLSHFICIFKYVVKWAKPGLFFAFFQTNFAEKL